MKEEEGEEECCIFSYCAQIDRWEALCSGRRKDLVNSILQDMYIGEFKLYAVCEKTSKHMSKYQICDTLGDYNKYCRTNGVLMSIKKWLVKQMVSDDGM